MSNILIKNVTILPMSAGEGEAKYFDGSIGVTGSKIAFASADSAVAEAFEKEHQGNLEIIDGAGKLAMPGMINTHTHVAMTLMRSYADDMVLNDWLFGKVIPFEDHLKADDIYKGTRLGIAEMLLGGTTCFLDMCWEDDSISQAVLETGIRAVISCTVVDQSIERFEKEIEDIMAKYGDADPRLKFCVAPHAPYTCSPDTIKRALAKADKYSLLVHTHINETQWEKDTIKEQYGCDPISYFDNLGLFDRPTVAAHGVVMDDKDIELFARKGVTVAHNPQSNMKLASGISPVAKMLEAGVNVALGTDGVCSNNDLDMWEEMRTASLLQKVATLNPCAMDAYQSLKMATVYGAKALGRSHDLGQLAEGFEADIVLVDTEKAHYYPHHDMVSLLVYSGKASDVDTVIVAGEVVVRDAKLASGDVMSYAREAADAAFAIKAIIDNK